MSIKCKHLECLKYVEQNSDHFTIPYQSTQTLQFGKEY